MTDSFWTDLKRRLNDPKFRAAYVETWSRLNNDRPVYEVAVVPWRRGVELHIAGVGVTQVRWRRRAEKIARDLIARRTGTKRDQFDLTLLFRG